MMSDSRMPASASAGSASMTSPPVGVGTRAGALISVSTAVMKLRRTISVASSQAKGPTVYGSWISRRLPARPGHDVAALAEAARRCLDGFLDRNRGGRERLADPPTARSFDPQERQDRAS